MGILETFIHLFAPKEYQRQLGKTRYSLTPMQELQILKQTYFPEQSSIIDWYKLYMNKGFGSFAVPGKRWAGAGFSAGRFLQKGEKLKFEDYFVEPVDVLDEIARDHDLRYSIAYAEEDPKKVVELLRKADQIMIDQINVTKRDYFNIAVGIIASAVMLYGSFTAVANSSEFSKLIQLGNITSSQVNNYLSSGLGLKVPGGMQALFALSNKGFSSLSEVLAAEVFARKLKDWKDEDYLRDYEHTPLTEEDRKLISEFIGDEANPAKTNTIEDDTDILLQAGAAALQLLM